MALLQVFDCDGDRIGAQALEVVRALLDPALELLQTLKPALELLAQHARPESRSGLARRIKH